MTQEEKKVRQLLKLEKAIRSIMKIEKKKKSGGDGDRFHIGSMSIVMGGTNEKKPLKKMGTGILTPIELNHVKKVWSEGSLHRKTENSANVLKKNNNAGYANASSTIMAVGYGNANRNASAVGYGNANANRNASATGYGNVNRNASAVGYGNGNANRNASAVGYGNANANRNNASAVGYGYANANRNGASAVGYGNANRNAGNANANKRNRTMTDADGLGPLMNTIERNA